MSLQSKLRGRITERLIELHTINYTQVNFTEISKKRAIYFLQGASITSAINVQKLVNEIGMIGREWRYITEVSYTIEFIDELLDDDRRLKAWLEKEAIIGRETKKKYYDSTERQNRTGLSKDFFDEYDRRHLSMTHQLSKFAHASYLSTISNTNRVSRKFDYYQTYEDKEMRKDALWGIFISEAVDCFLAPSATFPLEITIQNELYEYQRQLDTKLFS